MALTLGAIVAADFNGDGNLDLAVANGSNTVTILLGSGTGTFTAASAASSVSDGATYLVTGDFNGDGIPDLAASSGDYQSSGQSVVILLGNGDGTFTSGTTLTVPGVLGYAGNAIAVGDFRGTGNTDLVVGSQVSEPPNYPGGPVIPILTFNIFLSNGDGTFDTQSPVTVTGTGTNGLAVATADFNGDGKTDLVTYDDEEVGIFLSNGDGTFTASASTTGSTTSPDDDYLAIGDFNGDGVPDVALADSDLNSMGILLVQNTETATATLNGVSIPGSGTANVTAAYDGDAVLNGSTSSAIQLSASQVATTLSLTSNATTVNSGQPVTLTATLSPYSDQSLTTNGESITFLNGGSALGTGTLSSGVATLTVFSLPSGTDSVTAIYAGDSTFVSATSSALSLVVASSSPGLLTVSPSTGVVYNQSVTLTASTISVVPGGRWWITQDGLNCTQNGIACGALPNISGNGGISVTTSPLSTGTHTFFAYYSATAPPNNQLPSNQVAQAAVVVGEATPTLTWATPASITQGTALSSTQLDATASVAGTFVYNPPNGTVLSAGSQTLSVTFTPTDTTDYTTATATVTLTVMRQPRRRRSRLPALPLARRTPAQPARRRR